MRGASLSASVARHRHLRPLTVTAVQAGGHVHEERKPVCRPLRTSHPRFRSVGSSGQQVRCWMQRCEQLWLPCTHDGAAAVLPGGGFVVHAIPASHSSIGAVVGNVVTPENFNFGYIDNGGCIRFLERCMTRCSQDFVCASREASSDGLGVLVQLHFSEKLFRCY